jgi:hypothetical protein
MANWVDNLPGFTAPIELQYPSWNFRVLFGSLHANYPGDFPEPFPLEPPVLPVTEIYTSGALRSGSPLYIRALHPAGAPSFTLRFGTGFSRIFAIEDSVRLSIVRIR